MKYRVMDDGDEMVRDGESVKVPLTLCDTVSAEWAQFSFGRPVAHGAPHPAQRDPGPAGHQRGYLTVDTAAVRDARAKADAAYDAMVKRSCEAWKRPAATGRDAAEPNLGARPAELDPNAAGTVERQRQEWLGRDPAELARDLERRREAMRRKRAAAVANAWRTDPRRATTIERQGERWRGGR